jgi:hypothetical protein
MPLQGQQVVSPMLVELIKRKLSLHAYTYHGGSLLSATREPPLTTKQMKGIMNAKEGMSRWSNH